MRDYGKGGALTEVTFYILLALYTPRHGYAVMQFIEEKTGGRLVLGAGTLYGALNTLADKGWIAPWGKEDSATCEDNAPRGKEGSATCGTTLPGKMRMPLRRTAPTGKTRAPRATGALPPGKAGTEGRRNI